MIDTPEKMSVSTPGFGIELLEHWSQTQDWPAITIRHDGGHGIGLAVDLPPEDGVCRRSRRSTFTPRASLTLMAPLAGQRDGLPALPRTNTGIILARDVRAPIPSNNIERAIFALVAPSATNLGRLAVGTAAHNANPIMRTAGLIRGVLGGLPTASVMSRDSAAVMHAGGPVSAGRLGVPANVLADAVVNGFMVGKRNILDWFVGRARCRIRPSRALASASGCHEALGPPGGL